VACRGHAAKDLITCACYMHNGYFCSSHATCARMLAHTRPCQNCWKACRKQVVCRLAAPCNGFSLSRGVTPDMCIPSYCFASFAAGSDRERLSLSPHPCPVLSTCCCYYSLLSATIGAVLDARHAGYRPASIASPTESPHTVAMSCGLNTGVRFCEPGSCEAKPAMSI